jgi:hypothetical protein
MIARLGAGVLQMNGQPTAQNPRETGADGDLQGFRNWDNPAHVRELAELWKVEAATVPHWSPPTHAMQIWRYAEQGRSSCRHPRRPQPLTVALPPSALTPAR